MKNKFIIIIIRKVILLKYVCGKCSTTITQESKCDSNI